jgi:DNA polymerase elongation subunit (family B)
MEKFIYQNSIKKILTIKMFALVTPREDVQSVPCHFSVTSKRLYPRRPFQLVKKTLSIKRLSEVKVPEDEVFFLVGTANSSTNTHYLIFLSENREKRLRVTDVYPYFYVISPSYNSIKVMNRIEMEGMSRYVKEVYSVRIKHPFTREEVMAVKVVVKNPRYVFNFNFPDQSVSSVFDEDVVFNNKIPFQDLVLQETGYTMGMPYRWVDNRPVLCTDGVEESREDYYKIYSKLTESERELADYTVELMHSVTPELNRYVVSVDIEIQANFGESINPEFAEVPITSFSVTWEEDGEMLTKVFKLDNETLGNEPAPNPNVFDDGTYEWQDYSSERELLKDAVGFVNNLPRKIVVTYNGDTFDIPYISKRLEINGLDMGVVGYKLSDKGFMSRWYKKWNGKYLLDLYQYFSNANIRTGAYKSAYDNVKLDTVAEAILGETKYHYEGEIESMSSEELGFYNAKDTQLTHKLAVHDDNFPSFILFFIMRFGNLTFENSHRKGITSWWNGFSIRQMTNAGCYIPSRHMIGHYDFDLKGGLVLPATRGLHRNVSVLDFSSLYPTMMVKHNICYSTVGCSHEGCRDNKYTIIQGDLYICKERKGYIPSALTFFREARVNIYKPKSEDDIFYSRLSQFIKIFMNACYGCLSNKGFLFMNKVSAQLITQMGRNALNQLEKLIIENGGSVLYGDSVLGREGIIVYDTRHEMTFLTSIENLWNELEFDGSECFSDGHKEYVIPKNKMYVWDGSHWNYINKLIRHESMKGIYKVSNGRAVVSVTEDHSLIDPEGNMFSPVDVDENTLSSKFFDIDGLKVIDKHEVEPLEDSIGVALFLFSMVGSVSDTVEGYDSRRTVSLVFSQRNVNMAEELMSVCDPFFEVMECRYRSFVSGEGKLVIRFSAHSKLWHFMRMNLYRNGKKVKPYTGVLSMSKEALRLCYDFLMLTYKEVNRPEGMRDRWVVRGSVMSMLIMTLGHYFGDDLVMVPVPRGDVFHIYRYWEGFEFVDRSIVVKIYPDYVYDIETKNGTFVAGNMHVKNTDSVFAKDIPEGIEKKISEIMGVDVENEGDWEMMIQHMKKNYVLLNEGKSKIKGLRGKKKDVPLLIRECFSDFIKSIKTDMSESDILSLAYDAMTKTEKRLKNLEFTLDELKRTQILSNDIWDYKSNTPVVQSTKELMEYLKSTGKSESSVMGFGRKGVVVDYVKTFEGFRHVMMVDKREIDIQYYITIMDKVFSQITNPLGKNVKRLREDKEYRTELLEEFFV